MFLGFTSAMGVAFSLTVRKVLGGYEALSPFEEQTEVGRLHINVDISIQLDVTMNM